MTHTPPADLDDDVRDAKDLSSGENADLCAGCVACCTYVSIEIDAPRSAYEYDQWIWALHHDKVTLYLERPERWYVNFETRCRQLNDQGRCKIYGRHPVLCREYDPRSCERRYPLSDLVAWFRTAEEFEAWIRERRPRHWDRLMSYRKDKAPPMVDAPTNGSFVPIAQLAGSLVAAGGRRGGKRRA